MKKLVLLSIIMFCLAQLLSAQSYEFRLLDGGENVLVQVRELTGVNTPNTQSDIYDLSFGLRWTNDCEGTISVLHSNYGLGVSTGLKEKAGYFYQAVGFQGGVVLARPTANWSKQVYETVAIIGKPFRNCDVELIDADFDLVSIPNINIGFVDYLMKEGMDDEQGQANLESRTGLEEVVTDQVTLVQNPIGAAILFTIEVAQAQRVQIELTDLAGKQLQVEQRAVQAGLNVVQLPANALSSKTYLLSVTTKKGSFTHKLMKK